LLFGVLDTLGDVEKEVAEMLITQNLPKNLSKTEQQKRIKKRLNALRQIVLKNKAADKTVLAALKKVRHNSIAAARKKNPAFDAAIKKFQAKTKQGKL